MPEESTGQSEEQAFDYSTDDLLHLLANGDMEIEGRMPYSSNATLLVVISEPEGDDPRTHKAIYKPGKGERPLWDFPPDLYKREVAAYRLAEALGWDVIPPTVIGSGPLGEGSIQAFVDADFSEHYFTMMEKGIGLADLKMLCALDFISNNTDRKSGHCLLAKDGHIYGIDHGLSFHAEFKLRTVMWDFCDEPIPTNLLADIERFVQDGPADELACLLDTFENDAMMSRARALLNASTFPDDDTGGHRYPWPLV